MDRDREEGRPVKVVALLGECFYYQMRSRPTWQALSFHYQRTAMASILGEQALVVPKRAFVFAAAIEIPQLYRSFGEVDRWTPNC